MCVTYVMSKVTKKLCISLKWLPSGMSFVIKMSSSLDDMDAKWQYVITKLSNTSVKMLT
jgi:DNA gyrase inhibitor GyrI